MSDAANRELVRVIDFAIELAGDAANSADHRLFAGELRLLRRAIAYIDDNAHSDISLADVADTVYVTPRALQYMFRKHRDCTPMDYVRRVRLHHARLELVAGDRVSTSVGEVARRWGFAHLGRFATRCHAEYGEHPHETLSA